MTWLWGFTLAVIGLTLIAVAIDPWLAPDELTELLRRRRDEARQHKDGT